MTRSTRRRRTQVATALAIAAALVLTGCGPVDAGTAAAQDFKREFTGAEGIASIDVSGMNNLPFVGSASATVVAEAGLPAQQVDDLAADLSDYKNANAAISWDIELDADDIAVGITDKHSTNDLHLAVARRLASAPMIESARVGVRYDDQAVLVVVDAPESLSTGYAAAAAAVPRLGIDDGNTSATAVFGIDDAFSVTDDSWDGETTTIDGALRIYDAVVARFTLTSASITPEAVELRAASKDDVEPLTAFVAAIPGSSELEVEIQGGNSTVTADATAAADAVASALHGVEGAAEIFASRNFVNVTLSSPEHARAVLDAAAQSPGFLRLDRFGVNVISVFRVFVRPADFASSLEIAETAASLPSVTSVEVQESVAEPPRPPSVAVRFDSAGEDVLSTFASTMKPTLVDGGWDVWMEADGFVESFTASDRITLDDPVTGRRNASDQAFADTLVRLWNAAAT